ncbi:hypothetical protein [Nocardiopsis protaetiae]|uniref:hypothetical protein n=1 Tax=Nocardiopsis protaetiae TaxID=3382270 RepID=UPI00387B35B1
MRLLVWSAGAVLVVSGCASQAPEEAEPSQSPSPSSAAVESPSASPSVEVDPNSAKFICEDLRLRDAYLEADDLAPHEEAQPYILSVDAWTAALEEDAEPELREIAQAASDAEDAMEGMIEWCKEHTEPINPTSPW